MSRPPSRRSTGLFLVCALFLAACGQDPAAETTSTTAAPVTTSTVVATTTSAPEMEPAPIDVIARLPGEATLQDGVWAAVLFQQALECIPVDVDLATGSPADCAQTVIFAGKEPGDVVGQEVPVWLVRWPVLGYAIVNESLTVDLLRSLPTVTETTAQTYTGSADGITQVTGLLPEGGEYVIEAAEATSIDLPAEATGEMVALSDLTGTWESATHELRIDEGGSYELFALGPNGTTTATGLVGFIALQDGLLIFPSAAGPPCSGETGVYFGEMVDEELQLGAVDEPCSLRQEAFEGPWSLSSTG